MITITFGLYLFFALGVLLASRLLVLRVSPPFLDNAAVALGMDFAATYVVDEAMPLRLMAVLRALLGAIARHDKMLRWLGLGVQLRMGQEQLR